MKEDDKNELENNVFRPEGPQGKFDWLSTFDINYTLAQYENKYPDFKFLGAVPIDFNDLDYLPFAKLNFNEIANDGKNRIGVVFNLDEHDKPGSHWVAFYANLVTGQIYYYDSYGVRPVKRIREYIKLIAEWKYKKDTGNTLNINADD